LRYSIIRNVNHTHIESEDASPREGGGNSFAVWGNKMVGNLSRFSSVTLLLSLCAGLILATSFSGCSEVKKPPAKKDGATAEGEAGGDEGGDAASGDEASGDGKDGAAKDGETGDASGEGADAAGGEKLAQGDKKGEKPGKPKAPEPLIKNFPNEDLYIPGEQGVMLHGRLYDPTLKIKPPPSPEGEDAEASGGDEAAAGDEEAPPPPPKDIKKYPLVILFHGINGSYADWQDLPVHLVKAGYSVLAMDLRGHGKSNLTVRKKNVGWRNFEVEDWQLMPKDVKKVIDYFDTAKPYQQVDNQRVALLGAGVGANVAIAGTNVKASVIKALVLLSPSLEIKGLDAAKSILFYDNPVLIFASSSDPDFMKSAELIYKWSQGAKSLRIYKDVGQSVEMLEKEPKIQTEILTWLKQRIPPTIRIVKPPPPPPPPPDEGGDGEAPPTPGKKPAGKR
jgi:alpha-beta hydrolase superfamily lysophospholipase